MGYPINSSQKIYTVYLSLGVYFEDMKKCFTTVIAIWILYVSPWVVNDDNVGNIILHFWAPVSA